MNENAEPRTPGSADSGTAGDAPREREILLQQLIESVKEVFFIGCTDPLQLLYVSPSYETVWGRSIPSLYENPLTWMDAVHPDDRAIAEEAQRLISTTGQCAVDFRIVRPDGSIRWINERTFPILDDAGKMIRVAGFAEDITDRKRLEHELRQAEEFNRQITELTSDYAYTAHIDADGTAVVDSFSEGFTRLTGYTIEELNRLGGWPALIHPNDIANAHATNTRLDENERVEGELRIVTKHGETRWIRYSSQMIRSSPGGRVERMVGATQDITERHLAKERLRELSHRLLDVQEQERRHLARELHDEIGQHLTALNLALDAVDGPSARDALRNLGKARSLVRDLTVRVRDLSLRLRPTMLDDLGLVPALLWLFDRYASQAQTVVRFEHNGLSRRFGPEVETAAYRIVQEAVTNAIRHAGVNELTVRAWLNDVDLHLTIEDQGRGFVVETANKTGATAGLSGMQERAALLGGELHIESIAGRGTRIAARLPIKKSGEDAQ